MQHIFWRVESAFIPKIRRRCPRCDHGVFTSSGRFRLNANGSRIDVWLIYTCEGCGRTYNLTVYERVTHRELARRGVYERLLANDTALAEDIARDLALLKQNGVAPFRQEADCTVSGPLPTPGTAFTLAVALPKGVRLRTDLVLGRKLAISRARVQKGMKKGAILLADGSPCPKYLRGETVLFVEKL